MNQPILTLEGITAAYGEKVILENASLKIGTNELIVINGPNGGGKTTLLKIIAGLLPAKKGKISRQHHLVTGYLPQYRGIDRAFPITVEQTVMSGLHCRKSIWKPFSAADKERVSSLLETFHLTELAERSIGTLSGGQWQRTLLARSLAGNPELWLLDEPDTHLDAESMDYLHRRIEAEVGKRAIVIVTHNPESLNHIRNKSICHVENHRITSIQEQPA